MAWSSLNIDGLPRVRLVAALALALVLSGSATVGDPRAAASASSAAQHRGSGLTAAARSLAAPVAPLLDLLAPASAIDTNSDGRVTFLLLGSDARGAGVSLTDVMMVMSLRLSDKKLFVASLPRDTARIPNPFAGGTYAGKANTILKKLMNVNPTVDAGLEDLVDVFENLLHIQIDYYAMIKMDGFQAFVQAVEPIKVANGTRIRDPKFWDNPNLARGVFFPARTPATYELWAWQPSDQAGGGPLCNGLYKPFLAAKQPVPAAYECHRAMPFVRSRKGPKNSDFLRAKRQQNFVIAGIDRATGGSFDLVGELLATVNAQKGASQFWTNFDVNDGAAVLALYNALAPATLGKQVVFKPKAWSKRIKGTTSYEPKLCVIRTWAQTNLGGSGC